MQHQSDDQELLGWQGFFFLLELSVTKVEIWRLYYQDKF